MSNKPAKPLIMLEFNELCPHFLQQFMQAGKLPNFKRMYERSYVYTTDAAEEPPVLEPWIQWVSVHRGVSYAEHQVYHLGEGRKYAGKGIAELLSQAGVRVGVFGSMNTNYSRLNGYYIPDPWDAQARPNPEWLAPFFNTVSKQVQDSSTDKGLTKADLAKFGLFMLRNGLRPRTVRNALAQLASERKDKGVAWRRASLLEEIQYDLFLRLNRKFRPQFATFFCNSTAHYQHYYWRNMHPEIFEVPPDAGDHPSLRTAIQYGYERMDRLVGQFLDDFPAHTLILCTALSQQPWTETTKCTFRPREFAELLTLAGMDAHAVHVRPVMAEEFYLDFTGRNAAEAGMSQLAKLTVDGQQLLKLELKETSIFTGCAITSPLVVTSDIVGANGVRRPFRDLLHMVHSMRSGRHHPDGVLWYCDGTHKLVAEKVSLLDLAPTILSHFGVRQREVMTGRPLTTSRDPQAVLV